MFFFSSRRRHTRFDCDWSSDVCSSDLVLRAAHGAPALCTAGGLHHHPGLGRGTEVLVHDAHLVIHQAYVGELWVTWQKDRKSTRLNSSHSQISYAVFCLKKKKKNI